MNTIIIRPRELVLLKICFYVPKTEKKKQKYQKKKKKKKTSGL